MPFGVPTAQGSGFVLGVSADYHDAAAALVLRGTTVAAAEEERFSRLKHDPSLPANAIDWMLSDMLPPGEDLMCLAFYSKPFAALERVWSSHGRSVRHLPALSRALATWARTKIWVQYRLERVLRDLGAAVPRSSSSNTTRATPHLPSIRRRSMRLQPSPWTVSANGRRRPSVSAPVRASS